MKFIAIAFLSLLIVGCSSDPAKGALVAEQEVEHLAKPLKPLSNFQNYELKPLEMSQAVSQDEDKVEVIDRPN